MHKISSSAEVDAVFHRKKEDLVSLFNLCKLGLTSITLKETEMHSRTRSDLNGGAVVLKHSGLSFKHATRIHVAHVT